MKEEEEMRVEPLIAKDPWKIQRPLMQTGDTPTRGGGMRRGHSRGGEGEKEMLGEGRGGEAGEEEGGEEEVEGEGRGSGGCEDGVSGRALGEMESKDQEEKRKIRRKEMRLMGMECSRKLKLRHKRRCRFGTCS